MDERRIAIVGSREGINRIRVEEFINRLPVPTTTIVSGGAKGVDTWAVERAKELGMRTRVYAAQWRVHLDCWCKDKSGGSTCKFAGIRRNKLIVENCDDVVAFWDGKSVGTSDTISRAIEARKPVAVFSPHGNLVKFIDNDGTIWERSDDERDSTEASV